MKKIKYLLLSFICLIAYVSPAFAASYDVTVTSKTVTVGNTITLKIKGTNLSGRFNITSSNSKVLSASESKTWVDNNTVSIKLTAKSLGKANITVSASDVTDYNGKSITGSKTITITVSEPVKAKPKVKSSNNYLSSLSIDKYKLDKNFAKDTLEYSLTLEPDVTKIKINAQLADSSAKVTGTGNHDVTIGTNSFNIVVTAENGSKRTYKINVTVKDYNPIKVTVDNKEYTVIRREKDLPKVSDYYEVKKITIGEEQVDGYYSETTNYSLVALTDENGETNLFKYNDNVYTKYKEYTFNGITIEYVDKELSGEVKKSIFIYNDEEIPAYQNVKLDILKNTYAMEDNDIKGNQFYLFYGINLETKKEELYQYDAKEKTIQRFNIELLNLYKERSDKYYLYLLISILLLGFNIILFSIISIRSNKKKKENKKKAKKKNEE